MDVDPKTILIVDDLPANIDVVANVLRSRYRIKAATNGRMALKIVSSDDPPDMVLLDVFIPDMDGFSICRKIREHEKHRKTPVVFLTASINAETLALIKKAGGNACIAKTVSPEELIKTVQKYVV